MDQFQKNLAKISREIEEMVWMLDVPYIEACILYAEQHDIEVQSLAEILKKNSAMKENIRKEGAELRMMKKPFR